MKMTKFARVFQPIPLRLNYRPTRTICYLQRLFIHNSQKKKLLHALRAYVYFSYKIDGNEAAGKYKDFDAFQNWQSLK